MSKYKYLFLLLILLLNSVFIVILFSNSVLKNSPLDHINDNPIDLYDLRLSGPQINITTPENITYSDPMSGYYPGTYGFENDVNGADPLGWIVDESGGPIRVLSEVDGHKKVVEINDNDGTFRSYAYQTFTSPQSSGEIELWWRLESTQHHNVRVRSGTTVSTSEAIAIRARDATMEYQYYDGSSWHVICNYQDLTWHHVRIKFDLAQGWDLWLDGILQSSGSYEFSFANTHATVDNLQFDTGTLMQKDQWFDAVGYSWDSSYNIGENENEGLLLNFDLGFTPDWLGYSLNGQTTKTISGKTTIPFPSINGLYTIQVFGNNSIGTLYESDVRYFTIGSSDLPLGPPPGLPIELIILIVVIASVGSAILVFVTYFVYNKSKTQVPTTEKKPKQTKIKKQKPSAEQSKFSCPFCQAELPGGQKFCFFCGANLEE